MNKESSDQSTMTGMGRWVAVGSELPCSVVALLLVGQVIGTSVFGAGGATWGALVGAMAGFIFGVYGVYATIGYLDVIEQKAQARISYMPPMEDILEDVTFDLSNEED
jgi:hypothetical protein